MKSTEDRLQGVIPNQGNVFSAPTQLLCNAWCWWWWYLASVWAGVRFSDHQNIADICTTVGQQHPELLIRYTDNNLHYVDMNQESSQFRSSGHGYMLGLDFNYLYGGGDR